VYKRQGAHATIAGLTNASAPTRLVAPAARLEPAARALLVRAADRLSLSARSYHRVLRVARTIADLDELEVVTSTHVGEALRFRPVEDAQHTPAQLLTGSE
jgi:magnesium chelatase family protein